MNKTESLKRKIEIKKTIYIIIIPIMIANLYSENAFSTDKFNPNLLTNGSDNQGITDLSVFEDRRSQAPGDYMVDVWVNDHFIETRVVKFYNKNNPEGDTELLPCLKTAVLASYGVHTNAFPGLDNKSECANINAIPDATTKFNFSNQRLLISIPQAAMQATARGYVSPNQLDEGVPALLLNYRFSGANNTAISDKAQDNNNQFLNLRPGLNVGAWRIRNYSTWSRSSTSSSKNIWESVYTYLQRDIISLKSQLTLGESTAPSDIFESVPFTGAQMASDDEMLPESLRGYAPVVRGTARTNAQVIIRQNGYIIYQSYVAPGAFEISDLYATGGSGDLYVTIKESDGSEQKLIVPYASLPVLVREGHLKYSVTTGQYRPYDNSVDKRSFTQATAIYGLPWNITLFGGMQAASIYQSLAFGVGKNFGDLGAFSADIINSWATAKDSKKTDGQSLRLRYSKNFYETGTNFAIAGYRYSTRDYYSLPELMNTYRFDSSAPLREQARNRTELTLNQNLGENMGALSVSLLREDYWRTDRRMQSVVVGYNNSYSGINYGLNYSYNRNSSNLSGDVDHSKDQIFSFNISVPLDRWLSNSWANYAATSSKQGNTSHSIGLSGTALADNNLNWNVREGYTTQHVGNNGNVDVDYQGTYGDISAGYGYDRDMRRLNYGIEGGLLVHENGVTLSQAFGDTAALVEVPDVSGVQIINQTGVKTDFRGYTVVPNMTAYRQSDIMLDTTTLPDDTDLDVATVTVAPTRGAIVRARFGAQMGARGIMALTYKGRFVPFGAMVVDIHEANKAANIVGDGGQVYMNGLKPAGTLLVQWGKANDNQCHVSYRLPEVKPQSGIYSLHVDCQ